MDNVNDLQLLRGDSYELINGLLVKHPKLIDIYELDKRANSKENTDKLKDTQNDDVVQDYATYRNLLVSNKYDVADILWCELNIWYEDIKDWDFFLQKSLMTERKLDVYIETLIGEIVIPIKKEAACIDKMTAKALNYFLGLTGEYIVLDLNHDDIEEMVLCNVAENDDGLYIINQDNVKITEIIFKQMIEFLNLIHWNKPDYEFLKGGSVGARKYILKHNYKERKKPKQDEYIITLGSLVSSLIAKGTRYDDIWNYPIYLIYDLYFRHVKINEWQNTIDALHQGCIDTDKNPIDWQKLNWGSIISLK